MDKLIENIINEKFASKAQQRYFYAKANDKSLSKKERNKWKKRASEFSDKTNFKKLPEKVKEGEVGEQYFDLNPSDPGHDNYNYVAVAHFANGKKVKEVLDHFVDVQAFAGKIGKKSPVKMVVDRFDEDGNKKTKTWYFNYTDDSWEPEKKEDVDEVVDELGNIATGKEPTDAPTKGITQKKTTDQVVKTGAGSMGIHGVHGTHTSLRYWAESDMSKALGFEKTMGDDEDYEDAEEYFKKELGMDDVEAEDRLAQLGYDKKLAKKDEDKVRLVENPKEFIEAYIDEVLLNKSDVEELVSKDEKEINPILKKQLETLKKSLKSNGLSINDVVKYLKSNE